MKYNNKSIEVYKNSDYDKFKQYDRFKFLIENISSHNGKKDNILDIGCAKGELIYCLKDVLPHSCFTGLEYSSDLIEKAHEEPKLENVSFVQGDALDFDLNKKFDITIISGVLSIFDDYKTIVSNAIKHTDNDGAIFIFNMFNQYDIDVVLKYRKNYAGQNEWESGLNNFSLNGFTKYIQSIGWKSSVDKFELQVDLTNDDNPIASYTLNTNERGKIILNGVGILTDFFLVKIYK